MNRRVLYLILLITLVISYSCSDYLTVAPKDNVPFDQAFKKADDAISAVYGLYALRQPCVDQLFLAGDVQSDLVVAARGADQYIAEIAQNRVSPMNPYTDYSNFYRLIVACNNTIKGLDEVGRLDPVNYTPEKHNFNVAEIICIRAWGYIQLVKIWGDVPYYENTITHLEQVKDIAPIRGDSILAIINKEVEEQAYPVLKSTLAINPLLAAQFQGLSCPFLLHEINLLLGDYSKAADWIRPYIPYGIESTSIYGLASSRAPNFINSFRWNTGTGWQYSTIMAIPFDGSKNQKNNLMRWTNNMNGGIYAVKPSMVAINRWEAQDNTGTTLTLDGNSIPIIKGKGDYRGNGFSFYVNGKDTLISKYLLKSGSFQTINGISRVVGIMKDPIQNDTETNDDSSFIVYRDGHFFLNMAECWNNMGLSEMSLLPVNGYDAESLKLGGVRAHAYAARYALDYSGNIYDQMENIILEESALETAFEGIRWFTLVRFAKRHNNPSILANRIAAKYPVSQQAEIKARLSNPDRHYWPYYYKNVAANKLLVQKAGY
jgi:hypothetical protein